MSVWRWLIAGLLFLVGCTAVPDPTPTPVQAVAEVVTLVVERPSATHLPTLTPTPQATAMPELVATDEMPRATAVPTFTPIPSPTPDPHLSQMATSNGRISHVTVSSLGQLAFIQDNVLWVETATGSGEFVEIGRYAQTAAWSPNGSQLAYSIVITSDFFDNPDAIFEQRLWSAADGSDISLAELIVNYPNPPYHVTNMFWTPDGTKILLQAQLDERHEDAILRLNDYLLVAANLSQKTLSDIKFIYSLQRPVWLTDEVYILRYHCGSPCATIAAYSYSGESIWSPDWGIGGFVDFATSGNFMINTGRINMGFGDNTPEEPYLPTVDEIDLTTGEVKVLWEKSERDDYFTPFFMPSISPDERFFSFHYGGRSVPRILYVIDSTGQEYWQYANSFILDWRANNDLAISEVLESGESRLVYLTLTGESEVIFTTEPGTQITGDSYSYYGGGKWSPDDRFFIFTTENYDKGTTQLYLWQPDNGEVRFIVSLNGDKEIYNLTWLPNATTFYFSSGEATYRLETIWRYEIETAD